MRLAGTGCPNECVPLACSLQPQTEAHVDAAMTILHDESLPHPHMHTPFLGGLAGGLAGDPRGTRSSFGGLARKWGAFSVRFGGARSRPHQPFIILKRVRRRWDGQREGKMWSTPASLHRHASKNLRAPLFCPFQQGVEGGERDREGLRKKDFFTG